MKHTQTTAQAQHAQCSRCACWFPISRTLNDLIEEGIIYPVDVNLCSDCAEIVQEEAEMEMELYNL